MTGNQRGADHPRVPCGKTIEAAATVAVLKIT
jgi:hypothetical protein